MRKSKFFRLVFCSALLMITTSVFADGTKNGGGCDAGGCTVKVCGSTGGCVFYRCNNNGVCTRLSAGM